MSIGFAGIFTRQHAKTLTASTIEHLCIVAIPVMFLVLHWGCSGFHAQAAFFADNRPVSQLISFSVEVANE